MKLSFCAKNVSYSEALDGDIVQILFEENTSEDFDDKSKYILLSVNYEFMPCEPTIEWCDGIEHDGGAELSSYEISENSPVSC